MGINYSCPPPERIPAYSFSIRPEFSSTSGKDFYMELYWNVEKASSLEKHHLISLLLPLYLDSTSKQNINLFLNYYIHNEKANEIVVFLARNLKTDEPEGLTVIIILKDYYLENNSTRENEYFLVSTTSTINKNARAKGIYREIAYLEAKLLSEKFIGKNYAYFDAVLNPLAYMKLSKHVLLYPNSMVETPESIKKFMMKLIDEFEYISAGFDNPFVVVDETILEDFDKEYWFRNYNKLPREVQYYIDQTKLTDGCGLLYFTPGRLVEGNSLGLNPFEIPFDSEVTPKVLLKECYFNKPKI
jgi:hypothetical protein